MQSIIVSALSGVPTARQPFEMGCTTVWADISFSCPLIGSGDEGGVEMATHDVGGNIAFVEMNMQDVSNDATTIATGVSTKERASIGRERHKLI